MYKIFIGNQPNNRKKVKIDANISKTKYRHISHLQINTRTFKVQSQIKK
jgi:hypothetical protein